MAVDVGGYTVIMPECQKCISAKAKCRAICTVTCHSSLDGALTEVLYGGLRSDDESCHHVSPSLGEDRKDTVASRDSYCSYPAG